MRARWGTQVRKEWQNFEAFLDAMGPCGAEGRWVIRIDAKKKLGPGNCRWGILAEWHSNGPRAITFDGRTQLASDWASELGISRQAFDQRLAAAKRRGANWREALQTPKGQLSRSGKTSRSEKLQQRRGVRNLFLFLPKSAWKTLFPDRLFDGDAHHLTPAQRENLSEYDSRRILSEMAADHSRKAQFRWLNGHLLFQAVLTT
jgi:hypothetical protein